jgi:ATPase subunit of ABC transporter with duplicated ATPase domains
MIRVSNVSFAYGETPLYEGVNFNVGDNQKIGLVGQNGSGKSTLLKIIAGQENPSTGNVYVNGKVSYVPQEIKNDKGIQKATSVKDYVDPEDIHGNFEIQKLFSKLELSVNLDSIPGKLSGGQKTKLALAKALLESPDILILDEPTNFMDIAGKKWVMNFLSKYPNSLVVISHDLALMNNAVDKILYVNSVTKRIDEYKGNYSAFQKLKKEKDELEKKQALTAKKKIKRMEEAVLHAMSFRSEKGVRARVQLQRRLEKMKDTLPTMPEEAKKIKIKLPDPSSVGEIPIKAFDISKSYGEKHVLKNISLSLMRGERVAFIGPNGTGKSTFIKILMGLLECDNGEVIKNSDVKIGYYSQEFETFDMEKTVIDTFMEVTNKEEGFGRAFLGRFLFTRDKIFQKIETLSGGEKTRLAISLLTAQEFNVLILDEPTTYLDVLSQRIILEALKEYKGAMIIVSHTPEFVKELMPRRALLFPEERLLFWDDSLLDKVEEL